LKGKAAHRGGRVLLLQAASKLRQFWLELGEFATAVICGWRLGPPVAKVATGSLDDDLDDNADTLIRQRLPRLTTG
jgi:hypothetical protein